MPETGWLLSNRSFSVLEAGSLRTVPAWLGAGELSSGSRLLSQPCAHLSPGAGRAPGLLDQSPPSSSRDYLPLASSSDAATEGEPAKARG